MRDLHKFLIHGLCGRVITASSLISRKRDFIVRAKLGGHSGARLTRAVVAAMSSRHEESTAADWRAHGREAREEFVIRIRSIQSGREKRDLYLARNVEL